MLAINSKNKKLMVPFTVPPPIKVIETLSISGIYMLKTIKH